MRQSLVESHFGIGSLSTAFRKILEHEYVTVQRSHSRIWRVNQIWGNCPWDAKEIVLGVLRGLVYLGWVQAIAISKDLFYGSHLIDEKT